MIVALAATLSLAAPMAWQLNTLLAPRPDVDAWSPNGATLVPDQGGAFSFGNAFYFGARSPDGLEAWSAEPGIRYFARLHPRVDIGMGGRFCVGVLVFGGVPLDVSGRVLLYESPRFRLAAGGELRPFNAGPYLFERTNLWADFIGDLRASVVLSPHVLIDLRVGAGAHVPLTQGRRFHVFSPELAVGITYKKRTAGVTVALELIPYINMIGFFTPAPVPFSVHRYTRFAISVGVPFSKL